MPQLDYQDQTALPAFEGGLADSGPSDKVSRTAANNVAQVDTITLSGTPGNSETYTVTLNGVPVSFVTDASGTLQELYDGLIAALLAESFNVPALVAVTGNGTTIITLTAVVPGAPFTLSETLDSTGNLALTTATANVTGAPIPFGRGLARGSLPDLVELPPATGFVFEGISIARAKVRPKDSVNLVTLPAEYRADDAINVLRRGRIYVIPEDAVDISDAVFLRHTNNGATFIRGRFRTDDDSSKADEVGAVATGATARWLSNSLAGALTILEINIP